MGRLQRKRYANILLGMQIISFIIENNMELPQKTKKQKKTVKNKYIDLQT